MSHAPIPPNYKKAVSKHWRKLQSDTKSYQKRQKKLRIIPDREQELSAMEQFIKDKGVTICDTPNLAVQGTAFTEFRPTITLNWKG